MSTPAFQPEVKLPTDERLPGLLRLFDSDWVWQTFCEHFGQPEEPPQRIRALQFSYRPGARVVLRHIAIWRPARLGNITFFARVMPPRRLDRLLTAAELAESSGFRVPPLLGVWPDGGVA